MIDRNLVIDANASKCDYLAMQRDTPPTNAPRHDVVGVAQIARYDVRLAHDVAQRERDALDAQRQRDARRDAYNASLDASPITMRLRELRYANARSDLANRAFVERNVRVGPLPPAPPRVVARDVTPNDWEAMGPHVHTHKKADPSCHHPLVKCSHKW